MNTTNDLYIVRAPSGYGKTTYVLKNLVPKGYVHLEADMFFVKDGIYNFDRTKLGAAHKWCQTEVKKKLLEGYSVAVSNTNTTSREVSEYTKIANECKVPYRIIRLAKQFQNVHGVPAEVVLAMQNRMVNIPGETVLYDY